MEFLDERVPVYWGEWQMVEATLRLMDRALEQADPDYLVLLSGSCYPIRSNSHIRSVLGDGTDQFINSVPMPDERLHKPISRIERFRFRSDRPWIENALRALPIVIRGPRRGSAVLQAMAAHPRLAPGIAAPAIRRIVVVGTDRDASRYVLDFAAREPAVVRFFENTRSPDEGFFQTVLANSSFAPAMRRGLTYSDWKLHGSHPAVITRSTSSPSPGQDP